MYATILWKNNPMWSSTWWVRRRWKGDLYLTTELMDMEVPMVIALNMYDELEQSGSKFDYPALSKMIGIPIVPTVAKRGEGIPDYSTR